MEHQARAGVQQQGTQQQWTSTSVLIVGAGPVGLTLAIDLARRGVQCMLVEKQAAPSKLPKMERCNARSMEIYRRLGLAERIRDAGYPRQAPMDVFIVNKLTEPPILHLPYPSVADWKQQAASVHDGSQPLEPYQLISQYTLEPLLGAVARETPGISLHFDCEFLSFEQDADGVTIQLRHGGESGPMQMVRADYLVGCDGGSSNVRKQLGIRLQGEADILQLWQALFYCEDLYAQIPMGQGRHYHVADRYSTQLIVQDSCRHFTLHGVAENEQALYQRFGEVIGLPLRYEMLSANRWTQHLMVAERYGDGRVLLAGDAVHLMIPTGGLGMNTGVGDAIDLSWKLAGTLAGWGGPALLQSYLSERRQLGLRNVAASRYASLGRRKWRACWSPQITEATPEGEAARRQLAEVADLEQRKTNELLGIELGYRYVDSPLLVSEQETMPAPDPDAIDYSPSAWPGCRLPHRWLADGSALQDHLGPDYTLLCIAAGDARQARMAPLMQAMQQHGVPCQQLCLDEPGLRTTYQADLLLLRPDLHVAWRGDQLPTGEALQHLVVRVTGHQLAAPAQQ